MAIITKREWLGILGVLGLVTLAIGLYMINIATSYDIAPNQRHYESIGTMGMLVSALGIVIVSLGLAGAIFGLSRNHS